MFLDSILNESSNSILNEEAVSVGYDIHTGMEGILLECDQDCHRLESAMMMAEFSSIRSLREGASIDEVLTLQEGIVGDFYDKLVKIIKDMWKKVLGYLENVAMFFRKLGKAEDFVKKYKEDILKANTSDFEYTGYEYNLTALDAKQCYQKGAQVVTQKYKCSEMDGLEGKSSAEDSAISAASSAWKDVTSKNNDIQEQIRGAMLGEAELSASDFKSKTMEKFRGSESKEELKSISPSKYVDDVLSNKTASLVEKAKTVVNTTHKETIKAVEEKKKANNKVITSSETSPEKRKIATALGGYYSSQATMYKNVLTDANAILEMQMQALKESQNQSKDICYKLLTHSKKKNKEIKNESFNGGSVLDQFMIN